MYHILKGVKVIDLTTVVLGPFVTQILGDFGAEVIKVESPQGDIYRGVSPERNPGMGAAFMNINRNKSSMVLNLKTPEGKDALREQIREAKVFVHNMRVSAIEKLGFSYAEVKAINPSIVYCAATGFGRNGPYADRPAYDDIIQAACGLADLSKDEAGAPRFVPTILTDKVAGLYALYGILAALYHQQKTGEGMEVEAPMFESLASFVLTEHLQGHIFVPPIGTTGYDRITSSYRRPHKTTDGYMAVMPYSFRHWKRFFDLVGRVELASADWLKHASIRSQKIEVLYRALAEEMLKQPTKYWVDKLSELDIPHSRINSVDDLLNDRHLAAVSFFQQMDHPTEGRMMMARQPVIMHRQEQSADMPPPKQERG